MPSYLDYWETILESILASMAQRYHWTTPDDTAFILQYIAVLTSRIPLRNGLRKALIYYTSACELSAPIDKVMAWTSHGTVLSRISANKNISAVGFSIIQGNR